MCDMLISVCVCAGLEKYSSYKLRVAASTMVGMSPLSEEDDIYVLTLEDGMEHTHTHTHTSKHTRIH